MKHYDVIVIGGGQSGLATGYYLRRTGFTYCILDNQHEAGGAWLHTWPSLRLFSPAQWSSLPGMLMTGGSNYYPSRDVVIEYLRYYETKYNLPVLRPVQVVQVQKENERFIVQTSSGLYSAKAVVSATGTFANPYIPEIEGSEKFTGEILHSSRYHNPEKFLGKKVAIVGGGNSGAQILAEVSTVAKTIWITQKEPRFLPDHIDGRYLFDAATQLYEAQKQGKAYQAPSLGDIVMVPAVKAARSRNVLTSVRPFDYFTEHGIRWNDGREEQLDAVIFCTGFRPSLVHLDPLKQNQEQDRLEVKGTQAQHVKGLWLVGYGNWTGFASATLIGVGRSAKSTVEQITEYLETEKTLHTVS
jgi:putative flavoprotein involved in K+ transport